MPQQNWTTIQQGEWSLIAIGYAQVVTDVGENGKQLKIWPTNKDATLSDFKAIRGAVGTELTLQGVPKGTDLAVITLSALNVYAVGANESAQLNETDDLVPIPLGRFTYDIRIPEQKFTGNKLDFEFRAAVKDKKNPTGKWAGSFTLTVQFFKSKQ